MNAYELNDRVICAVGSGMAAAADRFAQRMDEIRERRAEQKASETNRSVAFANAAHAEELKAQLDALSAHARRQAAELAKAKDDVQKAWTLRGVASKHMCVLAERLVQTENALQHQSAQSFALAELLDLALQEIDTGVAPADFVAVDQTKRAAFLDAARKSFTSKTNVKKGVPPLPPALDLLHRPFVPALKPIAVK